MISQDKPNTHHLDNTVMRRSPNYRQVPNKKCTTFSKEPYDCVNYVGLLNTTLIHIIRIIPSLAIANNTVNYPPPKKNATLFIKETFDWVILSGLLRDYRKATCSTPTTHF